MAAPMLLHDFLFDIGAEVVPFQPVPGSCPSLCRPGGDARGHLRFRARRLLSRGHQAPGANRRRGTSRIGELPRSAHAPTRGLAAIAEQGDLLAVQRAFASAMLAADEHPPRVYFVDDHFVTYTGGKAAGRKGLQLAKAHGRAEIRRHLRRR